MNNEETKQESKKTTAAYNAISQFFDAWSLPLANHYLFKMLKASMAVKPTNINPSSVLYFFKTLDSLITAALRIHGCGEQREQAIIRLNEDALPDLSNYSQYFGWYLPAHPWQFIPRALEVREYANPFLVFKKLSRYANEEKWKYILSELQDFTFYKSSFAECGEELNILTIHRLLQKLIEAAHLIEVRAITEANGRKRPKWPMHGATLSSEAKLHKTIHDFFSQWKIEDLNNDLFKMLKAYLASTEYNTTPQERSDAIFNYESLMQFLKQIAEHTGKSTCSYEANNK